MRPHRRVLLLNASYEALNIVSAPKALALVWRKVAEIIEADLGKILRSPNYEFAVPSVIRLTQYIDIRSRQNRTTSRARILMRDKYRCQYCGKKGTAFDLTLDHIVPKSKGGRSLAENLVAACHQCNNRKADRTPAEARMPLLTNPAALYFGLARAAMVHHAEERPEWKKYLFLSDADENEVLKRTA